MLFLQTRGTVAINAKSATTIRTKWSTWHIGNVRSIKVHLSEGCSERRWSHVFGTHELNLFNKHELYPYNFHWEYRQWPNIINIMQPWYSGDTTRQVMGFNCFTNVLLYLFCTMISTIYSRLTVCERPKMGLKSCGTDYVIPKADPRERQIRFVQWAFEQFQRYIHSYIYVLHKIVFRG